MFRVDRGDSDFISSLRDADNRVQRLKLVRGYVRSRAFVSSRNKVDPQLIEWQAKLALLPDHAFSQAVSELFAEFSVAELAT